MYFTYNIICFGLFLKLIHLNLYIVVVQLAQFRILKKKQAKTNLPD